VYIEGANYLRNQEVSLMPWRLLCPGFNGSEGLSFETLRPRRRVGTIPKHNEVNVIR
jgi:hypothetical protein